MDHLCETFYNPQFLPLLNRMQVVNMLYGDDCSTNPSKSNAADKNLIAVSYKLLSEKFETFEPPDVKV